MINFLFRYGCDRLWDNMNKERKKLKQDYNNKHKKWMIPLLNITNNILASQLTNKHHKHRDTEIPGPKFQICATDAI